MTDLASLYVATTPKPKKAPDNTPADVICSEMLTMSRDAWESLVIFPRKWIINPMGALISTAVYPPMAPPMAPPIT